MRFFLVFFLLASPLFPAPIHFDAQRGRLKKLQRYIEKKSVDVDLRLPKTLETPLILAAGSNEPQPEVLEYLISQGANVNASAADGWTALMSSAQRNFTNNVTLLLKNGARPEASTKYKENALIIASRSGSLEAARLLLEAAPELVHSSNAQGLSPLMLAVQSGHAEIASSLIKKGADVNAADSRGWTALMRINTQGGAEALKVLIAAGADVNHAAESGWTPLMEAASQKRADIAALLIEAGADKRKRDAYGRTAYGLALKNGGQSLAEILK